MLRRLPVLVLIVACALAGCRPSGSSLQATARRALGASVFAPANADQVATIVSGQVQRPIPYAIENFLYAKHWLECKATQPGLFSAQTVCRLDDAAKTYGRTNGWHAGPGPAGCTACETWSIPIATAKLNDVTAITSTDATHGTVTYAYTVIPNELGTQLDAWMRMDSSAWCGPDPRADADWTTPRTGSASFVRDGGWHVAPPPAGFDATFGDTAAAAKGDRQCLH